MTDIITTLKNWQLVLQGIKDTKAQIEQEVKSKIVYQDVKIDFFRAEDFNEPMLIRNFDFEVIMSNYTQNFHLSMLDWRAVKYLAYNEKGERDESRATITPLNNEDANNYLLYLKQIVNEVKQLDFSDLINQNKKLIAINTFIVEPKFSIINTKLIFYKTQADNKNLALLDLNTKTFYYQKQEIALKDLISDVTLSPYSLDHLEEDPWESVHNIYNHSYCNGLSIDFQYWSLCFVNLTKDEVETCKDIENNNYHGLENNKYDTLRSIYRKMPEKNKAVLKNWIWRKYASSALQFTKLNLTDICKQINWVKSLPLIYKQWLRINENSPNYEILTQQLQQALLTNYDEQNIKLNEIHAIDEISTLNKTNAFIIDWDELKYKTQEKQTKPKL